VINFLASDEKMRTIFEALGMSGIPVDAWNILFSTVTAMICVLVYREQVCVCVCVPLECLVSPSTLGTYYLPR
jgi:hypothetical protein